MTPNVIIVIHVLSKAIDVFKTSGYKGAALDVSQQIDRMSSSSRQFAPCITPHAVVWSMRKERPLTGRVIEGFLLLVAEVMIILTT